MHTHSQHTQASQRPAPLVRDRVENFQGKQLLYVGWDHHTMICAPIALLVSPDLSFGELVDSLLPQSAFALHPDWARIDWATVEWLAADKPVRPERDASLATLGFGHKTYVRLRTPALRGIAGTGS
ncbi:phenol hydroxylase subunit P4 [Zoogloea sp.]|uniref:phenol hydroxylase subunit P4 n=1 Tax=Zoogloea sp. TaxID=49181 RepID=UPI001AD003DD|nr:phenol hydroxylase subunit P4 [Zoogloea sp.]MBN8285181.1 phenol hydroxylase subunit P4 [Zoogloea sp.]